MTEEKGAYDSLTPQYRLFVDCYINPGKANFNQTEAARLAGYSERSARLQGYRLMQNDNIRRAVAERLDELSMSTAEALRRLADMGRGSMDIFFDVDEDGHYLNLDSERARENMHLIKSIIPTANGTKLELHDSKDAIKTILEAHGKLGLGTGENPVVVKLINAAMQDASWLKSKS